MDFEEPVTMDLRRRILVVGHGEVGEALVEQLEGEGFDVAATPDPLRVPEHTKSWKPDLVLVQESLPGRSGRQVVLSLRANGDVFKTPIVGVLNDVSVLHTLAWMRVGATDIWRFPFTRGVSSRARELIDECDRSQVQLGHMKTRVLAWCARAQLNGTVTMYMGTPFEGRATFVNGELHMAQLGSFTGERALAQLLELEDGPMRWDVGSSQPGVKAVPPAGYKIRVLVVEDEPTLRKMVTRKLESAGYVVEAVEDGEAALHLAPHKPWDVMVVDFDLPRLDGWGLLRALREDVVLREIAVAVLSAHEDAVETLKMARAGARAYLHKSGRAKELLDAVSLLATPRAKLWNALERRTDVEVQLRAVGPAWLLRTLAELDCAGRLELEDALGRYEVTVSQGHLIEAVAQTGSLRVTGHVALEAILVSRADGRFVFSPIEPPPTARWIYEQLDETCDLLRREEAAKLKSALSRPGSLVLNEELAELFARVATVDQLKVLDALRETPPDVEGLVAATGLPTADIEQSLAALLRRGILSPEQR
ncbi:MAG: hypothetical protein DI536_17645 [Archangium gephyra]|uniref:Response regulatory domain-containing protein n=1 Tax=Archangium gephyra TaxID=48 RepID=A0A2W5T7C7_9BACT|nr:MAG: hypothetical protein DI536_17645 [Archangium gephyra]